MYLQEGTELTNLKLNHNQFHDIGGAVIGEAIARNSSIEKLDLSWNHLRGKGAEAIAAGLLVTTS